MTVGLSVIVYILYSHSLLISRMLHHTGVWLQNNSLWQCGVVDKLVNRYTRFKVIDQCKKNIWAKPWALWHATVEFQPIWESLANFYSLFSIRQEWMEPTANKFWDSQLGQLLQHNHMVDVIKRFCEIYKQYSNWMICAEYCQFSSFLLHNQLIFVFVGLLLCYLWYRLKVCFIDHWSIATKFGMVMHINPQNPIGHFASQVTYMMIVTFIGFCGCVSSIVFSRVV